MNNNSSDINQLLKQMTLTNISNENDKVIKVKNSFIKTHRMSGTSTTAGNALITVNSSTVLPYFPGFRPSYSYSNQYYIYSANNVNIDIYYIDFNYDEQVYNMNSVPSVYTQIPIYMRCINNAILISGAMTSTVFVILEPVSVFPSGLNTWYVQLSGIRAYLPFYMVPRNSVCRLSSIDYYRNTSVSTLSLLKWQKTSNDITGEEATIDFQMTIDGVLSLNIETRKYFTEGQVLAWFNSNTTSAATSITATLEIIPI